MPLTWLRWTHPIQWPALWAFDTGNSYALWLWTYRVWNGFSYFRESTWCWS